MAANAYCFLTEWSFEAPIDKVSQILEDVEALSAWWPSVYLKVNVLELGDSSGVGKKVELFTKGWLPYTLKWSFEVIRSDAPNGFEIRASGDFRGTGVWSLSQEGHWTRVTFDWQIQAEKPLLRALSPILKPVFAANHRWAMKKGEESLRLELRRRRGETDVPHPPRATWPHR